MTQKYLLKPVSLATGHVSCGTYAFPDKQTIKQFITTLKKNPDIRYGMVPAPPNTPLICKSILE